MTEHQKESLKNWRKYYPDHDECDGCCGDSKFYEFIDELLKLQELKTRDECIKIITPISKHTNEPIILSEHIKSCSVCKRNEDCLTEIMVSTLENAQQKILLNKQN